MNARLSNLARDIRREVEQLEISLERAGLGWQKYRQGDDPLYLDSVALGLHNFYSGLERLFERVARNLDGTLPSGANWHQLLLEQMSVEVPGRRPALLSRESRSSLEEYRGLRHVVRNVYAFQLDPEKLRPLIESAPAVLSRLVPECLAFATFLEEQAWTREN